MDAGTVLLLLLLLACPLAMFFMHGRGGHGAHAHGSRPNEHGLHSGERDRNGHSGHGCGHGGRESIDELRRQRSDLDREIRERETAGIDSAAR